VGRKNKKRKMGQRRTMYKGGTFGNGVEKWMYKEEGRRGKGQKQRTEDIRKGRKWGTKETRVRENMKGDNGRTRSQMQQLGERRGLEC
jgi:hypothetical protein